GERFLVEDQLDAGGPRQGLAGEVVLRRAEAAGGQDEAGTARGDSEGDGIVVQIVADRGVPADGNADLRQPAAEPLAVRVEVLPAGQLAANGDDFRFHGKVGPGSRGKGVSISTMLPLAAVWGHRPTPRFRHSSGAAVAG